MRPRLDVFDVFWYWCYIFLSRGIFGWSGIETLGVAGGVPVALVDSKLSWKPLISSDACSVSCFVISLYI